MGAGRARVVAAYAAAVVLLALVLPAFAEAPAEAHTDLVSSYPADGDRVPEPPMQVVLEFAEPMSIGPDAVVVRDGSGEVRPTDVLAAASGDVLVAVPAEGGSSGQWSVDYAAVAVDGHTAEGSVEFLVGPTGTPTGAPSSRAPALVLVLMAAGFTVLARSVAGVYP